jgi:endonuclease/exonuclease/phosphatase family metal-dependent hydrolase
VYLWPRTALVASHTDPEARKISDHLPVISDIRLHS